LPVDTPTAAGFARWAASRGYAKSTVRGHASVVARWHRSRQDPLAWLTAQQEASRLRSADGLPTASVKRYQQALQAWFEYSTGNRPHWVLPRYVRRSRPKPAAVITREQEAAVRQALAPVTRPKEPQGAVCRLLLATGARVGEITGLRLDDIEAQGPGVVVVHIRRSGWNASATKTHRDRTVPLLAEDAALLSQYLRDERPAVRSRWVFPGKHGKGAKPICDDTVRNFLTTMGEELEIPRLHPHAFRHLVNTRMTEAGVPAELRMAVLGQTNRRVAQGYEHPGDASLRNALAAGRR